MTYTNCSTISGGAELRLARERAGVTRAELAGRAGVSLSQLAAIEAGAVPRRSAVLDRALRELANADEKEGAP